MWNSEVRLHALNRHCILSIKFESNTKVETKRWKICTDSEIFRVSATFDNEKYIIVSPMLVAMSYWLFDNIAHENANTKEDEIKWRDDRAKYGDLYLNNEYWLCFGNARRAELTQVDQDWFLKYENSTISFLVTVVNVEFASSS